jgi:hypothetical protein
MTPHALARLLETLSAVAPVVGVGGVDGPIYYDPEPSPEQQAAAEAALSVFDASDEAQATWDRDRRRAAAIEMLNSREPAMVALRAFAFLVISRMQTLLTKLGLPVTDKATLESTWVDIIASGIVDDGMPSNGS